MSGPLRILVYGQSLPPLSRVVEVGFLFGLGSRSAAYRAAENWPRSGGRVILTKLLDELGIGYEILEARDDAAEGAR